MNPALQSIQDLIIQSSSLDPEQKEQISNLVKNLDKHLTIVEFKLERTEKVKRTMSILLEETIEELEQKRKAVEETNAALKQSLEDLKAAQEQLIHSEKMASLGELTAGIAHEIQNPLNFVNNFSDLNKELITEMLEELDSGNTAEVKALADDITENEEKISFHGKRADGIVKSMLQHSRTGTGEKEPVDINDLCDEYFRLAFHGMRAKDKSFNATIESEFDESVGTVNVISQEIGRVLLNLITNAFHAVSTKFNSIQKPTNTATVYVPKVSLKTALISPKNSNKAKVVEIRIVDNGPGIPASIRDKIFQPFFTTKPTGQGTGLGLSLSYDIIKTHGGKLSVNSKENEGSEFVIQLPAG